jgi:hypothetical protein
LEAARVWAIVRAGKLNGINNIYRFTQRRTCPIGVQARSLHCAASQVRPGGSPDAHDRSHVYLDSELGVDQDLPHAGSALEHPLVFDDAARELKQLAEPAWSRSSTSTAATRWAAR